MFQNFRRFLPALILITIGSAGTSAALAQSAPSVNEPLFNDPPVADQGWQGLANVLEALTPSVDTSIPLSPSQITDRIAAMIDDGRSQEALEIIDKRQAQRDASGEFGQDVQLMFLRARALANTGNTEEATLAYLDLTTQYPELPEPWNNLASLYIKQGNLDRAFDALNMALRANPNYTTAKANLAHVHLLKAYDLYRDAEKAGMRAAAAKAQAVQSILEPQ